LPTIDFNKRDFEELMGIDVSAREIQNYFLAVKGEVDGFEDDTIKLDVKDSNRPDLWSVEGVARELRAHIGFDKGIPKYNFKKSDYVVNVEGVEEVRPRAAYAIAKNVKITDALLRSLIQIQEKICGSYGKKRKDVAIGIFDLDKVHGKKLIYFGADKTTTFIPLGFDKKLTLEQILKEHPKGKEYGFLLQGSKKYPLLVDEKQEVLSMPPIINSEGSGKVEVTTKNLFLDVTGFDQDVVNTALLILCTALADRGATIEQVELIYKRENKKILTPYIEERSIEFDKKKIFEYFEPLTDQQVTDLLERKRYRVEIKKDRIKCYYLNYRQDILHPVDVIEDLIISADFNKIKVENLKIQTIGKLLDKTEWQTLVREAALGLGLQEVMTFTLTSKEKQYKKLFKEGQPVEIANPMSENISIFREFIFPEHLELLSRNQHISYPQNIYEVGQTLSTDKKDVFEKTKLCVTLCYNKVSFTDIQKLLFSLLENIGAKDIKLKTNNLSWFIGGRSAIVTFKIDGKEKQGFIGEINPKVLEQFNLEMPCAIFEIEVDKK